MHEELDTEGEYILSQDTGMLSAVLPAGCVGPDGGVVCETRLLPDIKKLHFQTCAIVGHAYLTSLNCSMAGMIQVIDAGNITLKGLNLTGSFGSGLTVFGGTCLTIIKFHPSSKMAVPLCSEIFSGQTHTPIDWKFHCGYDPFATGVS